MINREVYSVTVVALFGLIMLGEESMSTR